MMIYAPQKYFMTFRSLRMYFLDQFCILLSSMQTFYTQLRIVIADDACIVSDSCHHLTLSTLHVRLWASSSSLFAAFQSLVSASFCDTKVGMLLRTSLHRPCPCRFTPVTFLTFGRMLVANHSNATKERRSKEASIPITHIRKFL
jgi:hypothetical protein